MINLFSTDLNSKVATYNVSAVAVIFYVTVTTNANDVNNVDNDSTDSTAISNFINNSKEHKKTDGL